MLKKRSFNIAGHKTSIALEPEFWTVLEQCAKERSVTLSALVAELDKARGLRPLASTLRVHALAAAARTA